MGGGDRRDAGKIVAFVGQRISRECLKCGAGAGQAESKRPGSVLEKWICGTCGTLNSFEIEFREKIK